LSSLSGRSGERGRRSQRRPAVPAGRSRVRKISVTVDAGVLEDMKKVARRARRTLSAEVSEALERDLRRRRLQEIIEEFEAEHGVITDAELAKARAAWRG